MSNPSGFSLVSGSGRRWVCCLLILYFHGWGHRWGWAQQVELLTQGEYRPGEYIPLRISTEGPGHVSIRADQSLGLEWDAPGKTSITVPWMTWRQTGGELVLKINDRSQPVWLKRLEDKQNYSIDNPYRLLTSLSGPQRSEYSEQVYEPTLGWAGGVGADIRWKIAWIGVILILILLSIRLAGGKRSTTPWIAFGVGMVGLMVVGGVPALNRPFARAAAVVKIPSSVPESDVWVYLRALRPVRTAEPWSASTLLFPRSVHHLRALDPVVWLREDGLTGWIELSLNPPTTVCLLYSRQVGVLSPPAVDQLNPQPLQQRFYTLAP